MHLFLHTSYEVKLLIFGPEFFRMDRPFTDVSWMYGFTVTFVRFNTLYKMFFFKTGYGDGLLFDVVKPIEYQYVDCLNMPNLHGLDRSNS